MCVWLCVAVCGCVCVCVCVAVCVAVAVAVGMGVEDDLALMGFLLWFLSNLNVNTGLWL